jgi:pimeloyl-ACP methyl ester carboxylesterase
MGDREVNGIRLHYEERGEGSPILCIHGTGSSAAAWIEPSAKLAELGRVIAYDRRGHSRSERPEPYRDVTVAEHAGDAATLLESLEASPAVVIGRSYGGTVAVQLAIDHPELVAAIAVLEGDAPGLSAEGAVWLERVGAHLHDAAARSGPDAIGEALIDEVLGEGAWPSLPEAMRAMFTENGPAILAEVPYRGSMPGPKRFAAIGQPALLVAAAESPPEQQAMVEAMAEAIPDGRLERVGGGHLIDPAAPEVLRFVAGALGDRG